MARDRRRPILGVDRVLGTSRGGHPSDGPSSHGALDLPYVRVPRLRLAEPLPRPSLAVGRDIDRVELGDDAWPREPEALRGGGPRARRDETGPPRHGPSP